VSTPKAGTEGSEPDSNDKDAGNKSRQWIKYSGLGFQLIAVILVFTFAGQYLDEWMGWAPYGTVVLALTGVIGGLYLALRDFL